MKKCLENWKYPIFDGSQLSCVTWYHRILSVWWFECKNELIFTWHSMTFVITLLLRIGIVKQCKTLRHCKVFYSLTWCRSSWLTLEGWQSCPSHKCPTAQLAEFVNFCSHKVLTAHLGWVNFIPIKTLWPS